MDYPSEARYGQVFTLSTRAIRIGDKSLTFEQVVKADGVVACRIEVVMVGFDPVTRKSAQVPRHWRLP
jgi:acyl-CoA thioesterase FadM